jgi:hypothetical protein
MGKSMSHFLPTPARAPEECERHYTEVHLRMAQELLRPMSALVSYHVNRAVAQADVTGGWAQRPGRWRFVILRFDPGETLVFSAEQAEMVAQDQVNCLYLLRHSDVDETVLLDRRDGQFTLAKFMIDADRAAGVGAEEGWAAFSALADRIRERMQDAYGARLLILNRALTELECEPIEFEGQRPVGLLEETTRVGYLEIYFDHARWGREALGPLVAEGLLRPPELVDVNLVQVEEQAPLSR